MQEEKSNEFPSIKIILKLKGEVLQKILNVYKKSEWKQDFKKRKGFKNVRVCIFFNQLIDV